MRRRLIPTLIFVLLAPSAVHAQPDQHHETQVIEAPPYRSPDEKKPDLTAVARSIIDRTNDFRKAEKQTPVADNKKLMATARDFADYMARTDRYGHTADGNGPADRATKREYEYGLISENIAYAFSSEGFSTDALGTQLVEGWEKSPGHRKNMLDPDVTETGVAVARSEKTGYYYAVQMFGRSKSDSVKFEIANRSAATISYKVADQSFTLPPRYTRYHEQGRPTDLTIELPAEGKPVTKTFKGENKAKFVIVDDGGALKVERE